MGTDQKASLAVNNLLNLENVLEFFQTTGDKMKRAFLALLLGSMMWTVGANAYDGDADNNQASSSSAFGGTIGPVVKVSKWGNGVVTTLGGRITGTLWNFFILGVEGHGAIAQSKLDLAGRTNEDISYYYGGIGTGVRLFPGSFFHLTSYNGFGLGYLKLKNRGEASLVFNIEPEINAEIDLFSIMRIGAGVSYRMPFAKDLDLAKKSDLFGFGGQVYLEFGWL